MLGRLTLPRRARQLVPLLLGFLLGYSMRSLDRREEESPSPHGPPVEQVRSQCTNKAKLSPIFQSNP